MGFPPNFWEEYFDYKYESPQFDITIPYLFDLPLAMVCLNSTLSRLFTESLDASTRLEKINTTKTLHAHFLHSRAATA